MGVLMKIGRNARDLRSPKNIDPPPAELAMRALAFLTRDEDRLSRFLSLTGVDAGDVRALLGDRGFHLAVLDHLAGEEATLLEFVVTEGLPPEAVGRARRALGGGD
jgi:hypothetical protein